jgi:hypothetical protein
MTRNEPGPDRSWPPSGPVPPPARTAPVRTAPVRTAIALIVVMSLLVLSGLISLLVGLLGSGLLREVTADLWSDPTWLTVLALGGMLLVLLNVGLWTAALVLSILVIVRARRGSRLWIGGVLALAPVLLGLLFGIELTGDVDRFPDALLLVARILDIAGTLLVAGLRVASIVMLALGLRQAGQERDAQRGAVLR